MFGFLNMTSFWFLFWSYIGLFVDFWALMAVKPRIIQII